ncbi:trace amine-associated receptor 2 [Plakobranchus ocellatus]|uniref:Trace amine-associated receptor 2 n=1 Tax=Plakobranchus ocellatus TaxID=259542 RepID=A0AAV4AQ12_9GAST|nr:trace amine-associated receptor 2 [Plakobranchus ocellatus]
MFESPRESNALSTGALWLKFSLAVMLGLGSVILNLVMLVVSRSLSFRKMDKGVYLGSMASAGLLTGLCVLVSSLHIILAAHTDWKINAFCLGYSIFRDASVYISLLHMGILAFKRWQSINFPFRYVRQRSSKRALISVSALWIWGFAFHIIINSYWHLVGMEDKQPHNADNTSAIPQKVFFTTVDSHASPQTAMVTSEPTDIMKDLLSSFSVGNVQTDYQRSDILDYDLVSHSASHECLNSQLLDCPPTYQLLSKTSNASILYALSRGADGHKNTCRIPYAGNLVFVSTALTLHYLISILTIFLLNLNAYIKSLSRKKVGIRRSLSSVDSRNLLLPSSAHMETERRISRQRSSSVCQSLAVINDESPKKEPCSPDFGYRQSNSSFVTSSSQACCKIQRNSSRTDILPVKNHPKSSKEISCFPTTNRTIKAIPLLLKRHSDPTGCSYSSDPKAPWLEQRKHSSLSWACLKCVGKSTKMRRCSNAELAQNMMERQDRNAACWLVMLTGSLVIFWLPYFLTLALTAVQNVHVPEIISDLSMWLLLMTSVINPLVYGFSNAMFRKALRQRKRAHISYALASNYALGLGILIPEQMGQGKKARAGNDKREKLTLI